MKMNVPMNALLNEMSIRNPLAPALKIIADGGFLQRDGCAILQSLMVDTNVTLSTFMDRTGYECFFNSLHIEDYEADQPLVQAILFATRVFEVWNAAKTNALLIAVISADEHSVVTKFHTKRLGEQWLSDNMEGYEDPILSVDSSEDVISLLQRSG